MRRINAESFHQGENLIRNLLFIIIISAVLSYSAEMVPVKVKCPYCGTKGIYYQPDAYEPYIYEYPSKFEYIFWPYIDGRILYCCRKCWFTSFAWDFFSIPDGKRDGVKKILSKMAVFETDGDYNVIPMYYRLEIAENIYQLYEKDNDFWSHFYRVKGYHLAIEEKFSEAVRARIKAIQYNAKMITNPSNVGIHKELFYIQGAMQYLLNDYDGALISLKYAGQLTYITMDPDTVWLKNINKYLNDLIDQYIKKIESVK